MMFKNYLHSNKIFISLTLILFFTTLISSQDNLENLDNLDTCDSTKGTCNQKSTRKTSSEAKNTNSGKNQFKYIEYFVNQTSPPKDKSSPNFNLFNSSNYFDFSINDNVIKFVEKHGIITFPHPKFKNKLQGNFLHFMHLTYEKKLPVYFTTDQILYPYIEITREITYDIIENVFYPIYKEFLKNIINYGNKNNYDKDIILFFCIGEKFLEDAENYGSKNENEKLCNNIIKDIFKITKEDEKNNYIYSLNLMGNKREINKSNFDKINKKGLKGNIVSVQISNSLKYFQDFIFDANTELYNIYQIGKIISDADEKTTYNKIKKFIHYLYNEDGFLMNPLEIYKYLKNKNLNTKELINNFKDTKEFIKKNTDTFSFLSEFNSQNKINLFSYSTVLEDWVNIQLINYKKKRFFSSVHEFFDIIHDGEFMQKEIFNRYKNLKPSQIHELFKFRDGINMEKEFNETKKLIDDSYKNEASKWKNSYEYSFDYLLNILGKNSTSTHDLNTMIKNYYTIIGSYTHFKKDILLFKQYTNITGHAKNGWFPDIFFENNTYFYNEIKNITLIFEDAMYKIINSSKNKTLKNRFKEILKNKIEKLIKSYDNILKIIEMQNKNIDNDEKRKLIHDIFYYDRLERKYRGWYVELFRNKEGMLNFDLEIYGFNYCIANPIQNLNFEGVLSHTAMNFPEFGLISVGNGKDVKNKKLYIFSTYAGNEYPRVWEPKIDFSGLQNLLMSRK